MKQMLSYSTDLRINIQTHRKSIRREINKFKSKKRGKVLQRTKKKYEQTDREKD